MADLEGVMCGQYHSKGRISFVAEHLYRFDVTLKLHEYVRGHSYATIEFLLPHAEIECLLVTLPTLSLLAVVDTAGPALDSNTPRIQC